MKNIQATLPGATTKGARARAFLIDKKTGKKTLAHDWTHNLIFNSGLNALATGTAGGFAGVMNYCQVGSGSDANEYNAGGSAVFTQVTTTLTSSTPIFTSAMVGATFQYGATGTTGGTLLTISGFTSSTAVTVLQTGTVSTPTAGAVFMVNKTALTTFLYASNTYTAGSSNLPTSGIATFTRTYSFSESASYSVNEIGYTASASGAACYGRIVLSSTVSVSASNILSVEIQFTWTVTPATPTAFANVGTNINTAGNFMWQYWSCTYIQSSGAGASYNSTVMDLPASGSFWGLLTSASMPALQSNVQPNSGLTAIAAGPTGFINVAGGFSNSGQPVGVGVASGTYNVTTAGQTVTGLIWGTNTGSQVYPSYAIVFTTPVVLPTGAFSGTWQFKIQFTQTLTN